MNKRIYFHNMSHSDVLEQYANQQLERIEKFLEHEPTPIHIDLILDASKVREHPRVELKINSPHYNLITHYEHNGVELYDALDRVIDTMYRLLHEEKERLNEKRIQAGRHEEVKKQK